MKEHEALDLAVYLRDKFVEAGFVKVVQPWNHLYDANVIMDVLKLPKVFSEPLRQLFYTQVIDYNPWTWSGDYANVNCGVFVIDIKNSNVNFMRNGNCKASSTYLKIPLAICDKYYPIKTKEEADAWFDLLMKELPFLKKQCEELSTIKKRIKTEGAEYKKIMKENPHKSSEWKQAREDYENMILRFMDRLTQREQILTEDRRFDD